MVKMNKRIYGIVGIGAHMSNWNADFTGRPKSVDDGTIFGSDKALKYSVKNYWVNEEERVLYFKSYTMSKKEEKLQPRDLNERYVQIFEEEIDKKTPSARVLGNLFSAVDVMNFGATFAEKEQSISITGVVQVGQGMNKYDETNVQVQDILSPFRNTKKDVAGQASIGKKIVSDKAHYVYPFSVNPNHYDEYIDQVSDFHGYTEEAYEKLRKGFLYGATALNTNSKAGCENEIALFVTCKENSKLYLPQLDNYVNITDGEDGKVIYNLSQLENILKGITDQLEKIELFYNPYKVEVIWELDDVEYKNIYTTEILN